MRGQPPKGESRLQKGKGSWNRGRHRKEVHGNAFRRPEKYLILSENIKTDPFIRG